MPCVEYKKIPFCCVEFEKRLCRAVDFIHYTISIGVDSTHSKAPHSEVHTVNVPWFPTIALVVPDVKGKSGESEKTGIGLCSAVSPL